MKKISMILASMSLAVSGFAFADAAGGQKGPPGMRDCSKIENAERKAMCEKRQAKMKECMSKEDKDARRECMKAAGPAPADADSKPANKPATAAAGTEPTETGKGKNRASEK